MLLLFVLPLAAAGHLAGLGCGLGCGHLRLVVLAPLGRLGLWPDALLADLLAEFLELGVPVALQVGLGHAVVGVVLCQRHEEGRRSYQGRVVVLHDLVPVDGPEQVDAKHQDLGRLVVEAEEQVPVRALGYGHSVLRDDVLALEERLLVSLGTTSHRQAPVLAHGQVIDLRRLSVKKSSTSQSVSIHFF